MLRHKMFLTTALAAALLLSIGCKKEGGKGAPAGAAGAVTDLLPKETGFFVGISVSKLRSTKLWEMAQKKATEDPEAKALLDEVKAECAMDPMTEIESVMIAGPEDMNEDRMLFSVSGKFSEKKVNDCFTKMMQKKENKKVTITKDGKVTVYEVEGEAKKLHVAWLGDSQVLVSTDESGAHLKEVLEKKSSIKDNAPLTALMKEVDYGALVHGAGLIKGEAAGAFNMMGGAKPEGAYGNIHYQKDLDATIGMRFASDADAKTTADQINKELDGQKNQPMVGDFLKGVKVSANGKDAIVKIALTEKQITDLINMAQMFMGGMGGGGGMGGPPPGGM